MAKPVSNQQLMDVLFEMKGDVGALLGSVENLSKVLGKHIEDDKGMASDISEIQLRQARQKGAIAAVTGLGSIAGAVIGYAISIWSHH